MSGQSAKATKDPKKAATRVVAAHGSEEFLTMQIEGQWCGIPVLKVQDVLGRQRKTRVPLAPPEIAGALNLRGRIVTSIDLRIRLGMTPKAEGDTEMSVVVEEGGELYSLLVDGVGEVLNLPHTAYEKNPPTLDPRLRDMANGIYRLEDKLLVVLDVSRLLAIGTPQVA